MKIVKLYSKQEVSSKGRQYFSAFPHTDLWSQCYSHENTKGFHVNCQGVHKFIWKNNYIRILKIFLGNSIQVRKHGLLNSSAKLLVKHIE